MKIHLLRHAKTAQESETGRDFDRKLLEKGHRQTQEMQKYLAQNGIRVEQVFCSSAMRTRQTFSEVCSGLNYGNVSFHEELYLADLQSLLKFLWAQPQTGDVLLVGHNFGISNLRRYFTGLEDEMRTCEYTCLNFDAESLAETSRDSATVSLRYRPEV